MASVNTTLQLAQLATDVANVSSSNTTQELLMLSLAINKATQNTQIYVENSDALPNIVSSNVSDGQIYFVNDIITLVIAGNRKWLGLDGRVLRCDGVPQIFTDGFVTGDAYEGQIGDGVYAFNVSVPQRILSGFNDWTKISSGAKHTLAIRRNGTMWGWGDNFNGQLGNGDDFDKCVPVSVVGDFTDWCQVSSGCEHTLGVRTNGTLWAWGNAGTGKLGNGCSANSDKCSPTSVVGGFTDWCQASAGYAHSVAVRTNGTLWAWGCGTFGILGDGTTTSKCSPVSVIGGFTDWCQVSAGAVHTAAVRTNGTLWTWGASPNGALGDGTTVSKSSPVSVIGGFTNWCQVSAGLRHTVAVRTNGTLWSWGCNTLGPLGDGTTVSKLSPVSVVGGFTNWCQVAAGWRHTVAVRTNGTVWVWGDGEQGQLGIGATARRSSPVQITSPSNSWCQVSAGCQISSFIGIIN